MTLIGNIASINDAVLTGNIAGIKGDTGVGIASITENDDYTITIALTDGSTFTTEPIAGFTSIVVNDSGNLVVTKTDGTTVTLDIGLSGYKTAIEGYKNDAQTSAGTATTQALKAEGNAVGKQNGTDVESGSEYYHNNSKYYSQQASASATAAATSETNAAASETAVSGVKTQLQNRMTAIETEQTAQDARMDSFVTLAEGSTTGDAELADIRVGANGATYPNAGDAVRGQIANVKSDLNSNYYGSVTLGSWEQGSFNTANGDDYASYTAIRNQTLIGLSNDYHKIVADSGYKFRLYAWDSSDTYLGAVKTDMSINKETANWKYFTEFDLSLFPAYKFKVALYNSDISTTLWIDMGVHCHFVKGLKGRIMSLEESNDNILELETTGRAVGNFDFKWEYGSISSSTGEVVSGTYYSHSTKIPKKVFEGMKFNLSVAASTYAYDGDTFISRRSDVPATPNYQPSSSFLPSNATDVIIVLQTYLKDSSTATYSFDALATIDALNALATTVSNIKQNKGLLYQYVDIEKPYFSEKWDGNRISVSEYGVLGGAFIKFDSITFLGQGGFVTKTWADFKSDIENDQYVSFVRANDYTLDTLGLFNGCGIIYNKTTNKFRFRVTVYMTPLTVDDVVLLYVDDDGNSYGLIREIAETKKKDLYLNYKGEVSNRISDSLNVDKFTFAFSTDCHWWFDTTTGYINRTNDVIKDLYNSVRYDAYINGGDSVFYGTKFKQNLVSSMEQAFDVPTENMIYCVGNHDYNGVSVAGTVQNESWMLTDDEYEAIAMRKMQNIHRPIGKRYFYRDFEEKKIRIISLDTSDVDISFDNNDNIVGYDPLVTFAVRQNQLEWLRTTALDCPDNDWGVIIVMHVGLYTDEDGFVDNNPLINRSYLIQLLSAYVNKSNYSYSDTDVAHGNYFAVSASGTFANAKGHLVGVWSGHAHADGYCNKDGFNAIQTECGYPDSASRAVGTIDEICVDCVCVDMTGKTITLKRFGSGSDRAYTFV